MKLTFPLLNTTINVPVEDTVAGSKKSRRATLRKKAEGKSNEPAEKVQEASPEPVLKENAKKADSVENKATAGETVPDSQPLLMVEVVNVTHEKFRQTEEIKVKAFESMDLKQNLLRRR